MKINDFAAGAERLVDPIQVGKIHYLQHWLAKMPKSLQRKIVTNASKKSPKMGFVVEPYALFLFYEIRNPETANSLLPEGFQITKSRVFAHDTEKYYGIISIFRLHTSTFWGARSEFYAVAQNQATGLMSWIILDYVSDTISFDQKHGLRSAEAIRPVVTTTCEGNFLADISNSADGHRIACQANLLNPTLRQLDQKLWIEGNTSIAYGREIANDGRLFSLTFMPEEMHQAWEIPLDDIKVTENSWYPELFGGELAKVACFPFAQHMLADSPGTSTHYGSEAALRAAAENIKFDSLDK